MLDFFRNNPETFSYMLLSEILVCFVAYLRNWQRSVTVVGLTNAALSASVGCIQMVTVVQQADSTVLMAMQVVCFLVGAICAAHLYGWQRKDRDKEPFY